MLQGYQGKKKIIEKIGSLARLPENNNPGGEGKHLIRTQRQSYE